MNDEFRLTPADIRAQEFRRGAFGYEVAGVEDFRQRVAEEMERLLRERSTLEERLQNFREQLKSFREREKALNDAVVMAQQVRADAQEAAQKDADLLVREAKQEAEALLIEARADEASVRRDIEEAQRQFSAYLAALRRLLERQLAEVDALAEHERDGSPPEAT
ncbi:MAG: DivIVA domain-containing protein [Gemmatimonadales bacterium]|jgi:DivIVA domain-containing protein